MNISITLPPELVDLVRAKVATGRYRSPSDVVSEALRLLQRIDPGDDKQVEMLRRAWEHGLESGDGGPLDFAELRSTARRELAENPKASTG